MGERILEHIAQDQYIKDLATYSIATNLVRALPDWRDGLKPSGRRIIYALAMDEKAIGNKTVKSAAVVGTLMKYYHPHGDGIYFTIKTMVNPFEAKVPIIRGQGNFGTIAGDDPAAMRYTECSINEFGLDCVIGALKDSNEVIDWNPNYTNTKLEPQYLPVKVPLLLINGILGGIGTGIKADLPTHNLTEVIDATLRLIDNPNSDIVLIPDHCLPCEIIDTEWKDICDNGYGNYKARAVITNTLDSKDYPILNIVSLPSYGTDNVTSKIKEGVANGKFPQIVSINDMSQENSVNILIKLKKGSDVNFVKEALYKYTPCEQSFRINFEVVNGVELVRMSYKEYLTNFIKFAVENKIREYSAQQYKVSTKIHRLDAFIKIVGSSDIDKVIDLIKKRGSGTDNELVELLIKKYKLTDIQAEYIINAAIKQLSKGYLEGYKLEFNQLLKKEEWLEKRIANPSIVVNDVKQDLLDIRAKYSRPRICKVIKVSNLGNIPEGVFKIVITKNNYIRKLGENDTVNTVKGDKPKFVCVANNTESLLLFDNKGRVFKLPVHKVPIMAKSDPGIDIKGMVKGLTADIVAIIYEPIVLKAASAKVPIYLSILSKNNIIKKLDIRDFVSVPPSGIIYSTISQDDEIVSVQIIDDSLDVIIYSGTKALRIPATEIPLYKRNTKGVAAMNTNKPLEGLSVLYKGSTDIVVITNSGMMNKFSISGFERSRRYKAGSTVIKLKKGDMINTIYGTTESNVISVTTTNEVMDIPVSSIKFGSSISQGQKVIATKSDIILDSDIKRI